MCSINRTDSNRTVPSSESGAYRRVVPKYQLDLSSRRATRMCPEQTGEISDHIGYQKGPGEIGAARKLRSTVPRSAARRL